MFLLIGLVQANEDLRKKNLNTSHVLINHDRKNRLTASG